MSGTIIHIKFAKTLFTCPHCGKEYDDADDRYLNRCNKNKKLYTTITCKCGEKFGMCYGMTGDAVAFQLNAQAGILQ